MSGCWCQVRPRRQPGDDVGDDLGLDFAYDRAIDAARQPSFDRRARCRGARRQCDAERFVRRRELVDVDNASCSNGMNVVLHKCRTKEDARQFHLVRVTRETQSPYIGLGSRKHVVPKAASLPVPGIISAANGKSPS